MVNYRSSCTDNDLITLMLPYLHLKTSSAKFHWKGDEVLHSQKRWPHRLHRIDFPQKLTALSSFVKWRASPSFFLAKADSHKLYRTEIIIYILYCSIFYNVPAISSINNDYRLIGKIASKAFT